MKMLVFSVSGITGPRGCQRHNSYSYSHHMSEYTELRKLKYKKIFLVIVAL